MTNSRKTDGHVHHNLLSVVCTTCSSDPDAHMSSMRIDLSVCHATTMVGRPFLLVLAESLASEISRLFPTLDHILLKSVYWFWKYKTVYPFFCPAIFLPDMLVRTALVGTPRRNFCLDFLHVHDVSRIHVNAAYIIHYDEKWKFVLPRNMNSIYLNKGWK